MIRWNEEGGGNHKLGRRRNDQRRYGLKSRPTACVITHIYCVLIGCSVDSQCGQSKIKNAGWRIWLSTHSYIHRHTWQRNLERFTNDHVAAPPRLEKRASFWAYAGRFTLGACSIGVSIGISSISPVVEGVAGPCLLSGRCTVHTCHTPPTHAWAREQPLLRSHVCRAATATCQDARG